MEKRYRNLQMETEITLQVWNHRLFYIWWRNRGATKVLSFILFIKFQCCPSQGSLEYFIQVKVNSTLLHQTVMSLKTVSIFPHEEYTTNRAKLLIIYYVTPEKAPLIQKKPPCIMAITSWALCKNRKYHFLSSCAILRDSQYFLVPIQLLSSVYWNKIWGKRTKPLPFYFLQHSNKKTTKLSPLSDESLTYIFISFSHHKRHPSCLLPLHTLQLSCKWAPDAWVQ